MPRSLFIIFAGLLILALAAGIYLLLLPAAPPGQKFVRQLKKTTKGKPNILLITMDTTRADHLSAYGYSQGDTPRLDRLAGQGVLFEQCITPSAFTLPAHCSILTGLYPTYHGVRINGNNALSDKHETLATVLGRQGYACGAFIGAFVLDGRWGLKRGFGVYDDRFDLEKYKQLDLGAVQRPGNEVADAALAWMDQQKGKPFFAWVHFYDPHLPYLPPEPYLARFRSRGIVGLYDGEIAFMDGQIGRCIDWLRDNGLGGNTLVFLVGDHGEGLGDHGEMTHGYFIYEYAVRVPLIVVTPIKGLQNRRIRQQVRTIDLFSTILEMTGSPVPRNHGESLLPLLYEPGKADSRPAYSESLAPNVQYGWAPLYSLRRYPLKFIDAPRPELYDLQNDPQEEKDIKLKQSRLMKKMQAELKSLMAVTGRGAPDAESADLDSETVRRLASLGYIGTSNTLRTSASLADPKDKLEIFAAVTAAGEKISQEKYAEAAGILQPILAKDPTVIQANLFLSNCLTRLHRSEEAKSCLDQILKQDANQVQALISLANILSNEGKDQDVIALCQKALAVDSRSTQAYTLLGEIYMKKSDHAHALPYLQKAVSIQPKMTQNLQNLAACYIGLKRYDRAEPLLWDVVSHHPRFPLSHFHLGLLYEEQGRLAEAKKSYEEELLYYPGEFSPRFNLAKLLYREGDLPGYLGHMEDVMKTAPHMPQGYLFLARGLLHTDASLNRITALVEKGLSLAKDNELKALGYFLLADIYSRRKQADKVQEALARANSYKNNRR